MRPLTDVTPKPLLLAGGRALLDYPLRRLARAGIDEVVINLAWQGQQIRDYVADGHHWGLRVSFSDEGDQALETGGGIRQALPRLGDEPFWLVNGDVFCDFAFRVRGLDPGTLAHLILVPNPPHNPGGDFALADGQVRSTGGPRFTYSGLAVIHPDLLAGHAPGRFPLAPLLAAAAENDGVSGELYEGLWTDAGTPARLAALDRELVSQTSR